MEAFASRLMIPRVLVGIDTQLGHASTKATLGLIGLFGLFGLIGLFGLFGLIGKP